MCGAQNTKHSGAEAELGMRVGGDSASMEVCLAARQERDLLAPNEAPGELYDWLAELTGERTSCN